MTPHRFKSSFSSTSLHSQLELLVKWTGVFVVMESGVVKLVGSILRGKYASKICDTYVIKAK